MAKKATKEPTITSYKPDPDEELDYASDSMARRAIDAHPKVKALHKTLKSSIKSHVKRMLKGDLRG